MTRRPAAAPVPALPAQRSLDRLEQVRVLAHPLRLRLLELFAESPRTTKQAADKLGLPPTRLYHHVAALERVGLVRVRETRRNRGTIEKHYEAVARGFEVDPSQLARGHGKGTRVAAARLANESVAALAMRVIERAGDSLMAALDAATDPDLDPEDVRRPVAMGIGIVATPERVRAMRDELLAVVQRWQTKMQSSRKSEEKVGETTMRAWLTIVFAPEVEMKKKEREEKRIRKVSGSGGRKPGGGT